MALNLTDKQKIVAEVSEQAKGALSAVVADSCGITATKMDALRKSSREAGVYVRIVRNTLLKRAVEGTEFACMDDVFAGPTLIAFSMKHPGAAARIFKEFAKKEDKFKVKGCAYEGEFIPADQLDVLASLPTFEEGVAQIMAVLKEAAAGRLVRTIAAVAEMKETEAPAEAAAPAAEAAPAV